MEKVAVLASGGLDSSVLLADMARSSIVHPVYIRKGLMWEEPEIKALQAFAAALNDPNILPLTVLDLPIRSIYGQHWSVTGKGMPAADAPDLMVFLPGRNVLLIGLTAVWCATHGVERIAIGSLRSNPFPDATPEFFKEFGGLLSKALSSPIDIVAPYRDMNKEQLIQAHAKLPLEKTLTCIAPTEGSHCGACNKCRERQVAFKAADVPDRTAYRS